MTPSSVCWAPGEPHAGLEVDLAAPEGPLERLGAGLVLVGDEPRQRLDDGHLGAEALEDRGELDADDAAAEHDDPAGHVVERERLVARHDAAADVEAGQRASVGPGGQDDVAALEPAAADLDGVGGHEPAVTLDDLDLARLHQPGEALVEPPDDRVLVLVDARSCRCPRARCARRTARSRGCGRRSPPRAAAPSSGCTRGAGRCRRPCPARPSRPRGSARPHAGPRRTRRCRRRG